MALYRGYNTIDQSGPKTRLEDTELIKRDILNHFNIRRGEKLMNVEFGTIIWDSLFEPMTDLLRNSIIEDVNNIVNFDPRVEVDSVLVDTYEHGLVIEARIRYKNTNQTEIMRLLFDRELNEIITR